MTCDMHENTRLDGVASLVDAKHVKQHLVQALLVIQLSQDSMSKASS